MTALYFPANTASQCDSYANGGLVDTGSGAGTGITRNLLGYDLDPGWYPPVNSVLGIITLALMAIGALALTRSSVVDYYRKASWQRGER